MTPAEFAAKVEWEGGICGALFEYGLNADDLDDSDPGLKSRVRRFIQTCQSPYLDLQQMLEQYT